MNILVIDGQGGRLGRKLVENIRKICPEADITAVGINSIATGNMMNSGCADQLATGENAVASSPAYRILIPMNLCRTYIAGVASGSAAILEDAMQHIRQIIEKENGR